MPPRHPPAGFFPATDHAGNARDAARTAQDEQQLEAIAARVARLLKDASQRLEDRGRDRAGALQQSVQREADLSQLGRRVRQLGRMGPDACLGFMEESSTGRRLYIGRLGLSDEDGRQLLIDWRAPAAEPFFAATHQDPRGLSRRRRYRWRGGAVVNYWDEVFDMSLLEEGGHLDDHSMFLASLGESRTGKMQDVLSTIQVEQDAIIRAPSTGALVVDGGPGTGKTVVALHRAAYLLHADRRLHSQRGRILFVSPHDSYTDYVSDILPHLGEDAVRVSTLDDLVEPGVRHAPEMDQRIAALKGSAAMLQAVHRAVSVFEQPPAGTLLVETAWADLDLTPSTWLDAVRLLPADTSHNDARPQLAEALAELLAPQLTSMGLESEAAYRELRGNPSLAEHLDEHWPLLDPENLLRTLLSNRALLGYSASRISPQDIDLLLEQEPVGAWSREDLALLDAARHRLGDPQRTVRQAVLRAEAQSRGRQIRRVIDDLLAGLDDKEDLVSQLVNADLQDELLGQSDAGGEDGDPLLGPFGHVIIDEAQDLSDAQWAMVLQRCPSMSLTIVGDRAQAVGGFVASWEERLDRVGIHGPRLARLAINYRGTRQVMERAAAEIHGHLPDANIPQSIREGAEVAVGPVSELEPLLRRWLDAHPIGVAAVIGGACHLQHPRVTCLSPAGAKGLEFDLVVLLRPGDLGSGLSGAVRRYVAMTRATAQLVLLE